MTVTKVPGPVSVLTALDKALVISVMVFTSLVALLQLLLLPEILHSTYSGTSRNEVTLALGRVLIAYGPGIVAVSALTWGFLAVVRKRHSATLHLSLLFAQALVLIVGYQVIIASR